MVKKRQFIRTAHIKKKKKNKRMIARRLASKFSATVQSATDVGSIIFSDGNLVTFLCSHRSSYPK